MSVLPVRMYGDPVLREIATPIDDITPQLRQLAEDMAETMYAYDGIGLAGNQVGILQRIVVIDVSDEYARSKRNGKRTKPTAPQYEVLLNPQIISASDEDAEYSEGCLSIPLIEGKIFRPARISVQWQDLDGNTHTAEADDLRGRVLQHEIDHLNGVLFIDHMPTTTRARLAGKLNKLRQKTEETLASQQQQDDCGCD